MKTIRSVIGSLTRSPLKSVLTLLTVGLGVGVLIFALGISSAFTNLFKSQLEKDGIVVMVANATMDETTGEMETVRPPQLDERAMDVLQSDVEGVEAIAPISGEMGGGMGEGMFNQVVVGDAIYRLRSVVSTDEGYEKVMGLEMAAGSFFTAYDVDTGARKAVISETTATILYGSAEAALGQVLKSPAPPAPPAASNTTAPSGQSAQISSEILRGMRARQFVSPTFTVSGVFKDVSELARTSYGIGDVIVPYTSMMPQGVNAEMSRRFMLSNFAVLVKGSSLRTLEAQVRATLAGQYGDDVSIVFWEGTPQGASATLEEARSTVSTFSLVVNLLGFVLLITGSIGILSIMLVEVLGRSREIALERALGASRRALAAEYFTRSLVLAGMSAAIGMILSLAFAQPLKSLVLPIFNGVSAADLSGSVITPTAIAIGVGSALLVGGVFGVFPLLPALRTNISDGIREASL